MLDFIAYAEKRWGDRIGCYILSGGGTSEWYEYDRGRTSRNKDRAWAAWCKQRGLDFGESVPAQPSLAKAAFENLVYDPAAEAAKIAYWQFHNSLPADALLEFAAAARKAVPKAKEIGVFFGYYLVSDSKHTSFGHLDYERVYASPDIDFFIAPGNYSDRPIGGGSGSQLVHGTALRHGKRFLHEIDFGPHDQKRWGKGQWKTLGDDLAGNTREAAFAMANNANYWWFDMWGGFYRDPKVRERIAALKKAQDRLVPAPSAAEILLVCDPQSIYYVNPAQPALEDRRAARRLFVQRPAGPRPQPLQAHLPQLHAAHHARAREVPPREGLRGRAHGAVVLCAGRDGRPDARRGAREDVGGRRVQDAGDQRHVDGQLDERLQLRLQALQPVGADADRVARGRAFLRQGEHV